MRVLTYTSLFPNTQKPLQGLFILQRIRHLALLGGNEVHVIAPMPFFPRWLRRTRWGQQGQIPSKEVIDGLTVFHPRYPLLPKLSMPFHGLLMFLGGVFLARRLHRELKFDCIDAHFVYPDGFAAILLGKVLSLPVVISARGSDINLYPRFRVIRPLIRWTLRRAAGLVAVSASLRDVMLQLGAEPKQVRVIGNGIDRGRFFPAEAGDARSHLGLPVRGKLVVSVAALIPAKGLHLLISAFARVLPRFPGLRLYVLGEGKERSNLEALIREYGVESSVLLAGSVPNEQLRYWYSAANLSCLVSSREGWPNVLQESLACGTPVLATRVWGAPEIIVSPELGMLVDQNVDEISGALESALEKHWDRRAIAEHAAKRTWQTVASEMEEFLRSTIRSNDQPGIQERIERAS